jgi:hypothetical protein
MGSVARHGTRLRDAHGGDVGGIVFLSLCAASIMMELAHAHARVNDVAEPLALMAPTGPHNTKTRST